MSRRPPGPVLLLAACPDPGDAAGTTPATSVTTVPISGGTTASGSATDPSWGATDRCSIVQGFMPPPPCTG